MKIDIDGISELAEIVVTEDFTPIAKQGWLRVRVGKQIVRVDRLVLQVFRGACPRGMTAIHLNDDLKDNRLVNLKWGVKPAKPPRCKLTPVQIKALKTLHACGWSQTQIALALKVSQALISQILIGKHPVVKEKT